MRKKPFDEGAWFAKTAKKRAIPRVFNISEAAHTAAAILQRGGEWLHVQVLSILKAQR